MAESLKHSMLNAQIDPVWISLTYSLFSLCAMKNPRCLELIFGVDFRYVIQLDVDWEWKLSNVYDRRHAAHSLVIQIIKIELTTLYKFWIVQSLESQSIQFNMVWWQTLKGLLFAYLLKIALNWMRGILFEFKLKTEGRFNRPIFDFRPKKYIL